MPDITFSQAQFPTHDRNPGGPSPGFLASLNPGMTSVNELPGMGDFGALGRSPKRRVREAARLYSDALSGRIDPFLVRQAMHPTAEIYVRHLAERYPGLYGDPGGRQLGLRETMSFSDYQALFADVLDRKYYGWYNSYPVVYYPIVRRQTLMDFRVVKRYLYDGMVTPWSQVDPGTGAPMQSLTGPVPQGGATPATSSTAALTYQPAAYQSGSSINWRAFVNDDLGIFNDVSQRLAIEGNRGISKFLTGQFFDVNGPHASLYKAGFNNIINLANGASSNNPRLGAQGIMDGMKVLASMKDDTGNPILVGGRVFLVYGPGDVAIVKNLMSSLTLNVANEGGSLTGANFPQQWLQVTNWLTAELTPIMDPYLSIVASTNPHSWVLVVDPQSSNRPVVEFGNLKGFDTPQIFQRVPSIQRLGGGLETMMGSFDNLNSDLKIIGVHGALQVDGRTTVGSNGSGA